jgi:hypothetical protein
VGDRDRGSLPTRHYNGKAAVRGNAFSPSVAPFTAVENDMTNQIRQTVLKGAAVAAAAAAMGSAAAQGVQRV